MSKLARVAIAAAVVLATAGILVLVAMYTWAALAVCALVLVALGCMVYDFLSIRSRP